MLSGRGDVVGTRDLPLALYSTFGEGLDTKHLRDAKALLTKLG